MNSIALAMMGGFPRYFHISEVVALKREHIDLSRKVIYVRLGEGCKDRCPPSLFGD